MMAIFWNRKHIIEAEKRQEKAADAEVTKMKREVHKVANQTNKDIKKLNSLLKRNDITLNIHIATGHHNGR